ncbi:MAG: peptidoglycan-binding protein, partial [Clostridia bacterium]|nr:peptidoglycan-binding protein [Clostridia bacterium]
DEYSDGTAEAIRAFQVRNGMHSNGLCDAATFEKLFSDDALTYAMVKGSSGEDVTLAKERLIELGYLDGAPLGEYDEQTEAAVRRFRKKNNLSDDVIIDNDAFEVLLGEDTVGNFYAIGDKDEVIETYQRSLYTLGYLTYLPDGVFGKQTQNAVRRFQEENGLVVDGCLGKSTVDLLKSGKAEPFAFTAGTEGADVERIQQRLAHFGYLSSGQVTGYYGDKTQTAVKSFQKRNGLKNSGLVDYETMQKLLSEDAKKAPATPKPATPKPTKKPGTTKKPTTPKPGTTPKPTKKPDEAIPAPAAARSTTARARRRSSRSPNPGSAASMCAARRDPTGSTVPASCTGASTRRA